MGRLPTRFEATVVGVACLAALYASGDALVAFSLAVLWFIWKALPVKGMPPVLPLALTYQWFQAAGGLIYCVAFDRDLPVLHVPEHRAMVLIGLGCVMAITVGLMVGTRIFGVQPYPAEAPSIFPTNLLITAYAALTVFEGTINQFAWRYPMLTQAILAIGLIRLGVLYLLLRRFMDPELRLAPFGALLALEIMLGFTGFFASFREGVAITAMVLYQGFNWRRPGHAVAMAALLVIALLTGIVWMSVRGQFRAEQVENTVLAQSRSARFERISELVDGWFRSDDSNAGYDVDFLVDRMWVVYYPSLALARVPTILPHTDGAFVMGALRHVVTPRFLFPNKPELTSNSDKVRQYSGVWVAGRDEGTSIAFGYAIEAYVDYGLPAMFIPVFIYGTFMGMVFALFMRWIRLPDFGVPLLTVVFWLSLYLFEESWAKMLGDNVTVFLYLGGVVYILERMARSGRLGQLTSVTHESAPVALYPAILMPSPRVQSRTP
jgi:hypothetical protein